MVFNIGDRVKVIDEKEISFKEEGILISSNEIKPGFILWKVNMYNKDLPFPVDYLYQSSLQRIRP